MKRSFKLFERSFCAGLLTLSMMLAAVGCTGSQKSQEPQLVRADLHTEAQASYLAGDYKLYKTYANGTDELSRPSPAVIPVPEGMEGECTLELSGGSVTKTYMAENGEFKLWNLMIGSEYEYRISCGEKSVTGKLVTEDICPRNLFVPGITNMRDLGGWKREDGSAVKQGLIFRSAKFNPDDSGELLATEEGRRILLEDLGIKTEIDLRNTDETGGISGSPLGESVKYCPVPFKSGGNIILLNKDSLPGLFAILGDRANYPVVFHCSIGTDRTGMVAFLINGLMGVAESDLYTDFLFSNFGQIGKLRTPSIIDTYIQTVGSAAGDKLSEKIYNYLVQAGVSPEDIESLRSILAE